MQITANTYIALADNDMFQQPIEWKMQCCLTVINNIYIYIDLHVIKHYLHLQHATVRKIGVKSMVINTFLMLTRFGLQNSISANKHTKIP